MKSQSMFVTGATGKTGSRIAARLAALGHEIRQDSRNASPTFDWNDDSNRGRCLSGVSSVYINYSPDTREGLR